MKHLLLISFLLILFIPANSLLAQNSFIVDKVIQDGDDYTYYGELVSNSEYSYKVISDDVSADDEQFSIVVGHYIYTFFPDWPTHLEEYFYANRQRSFPPTDNIDKIPADIITKAKVFRTDLFKKKIDEGSIDEGSVYIEYELNPKQMTIYFFGLKYKWLDKTKIKKV